MNFDRKQILALRYELEEVGYVNDEQTKFGSAFEHQREDIFEDLAKTGYSKSLAHSGGFFDENGAVYWYYDPDLVSYLEAKKLTLKWVCETSNKGAD